MTNNGKQTKTWDWSKTPLVLASHNTGKIAEMRDLFGAHVKEIKSAGDFNLKPPLETGKDFYANALLKARYVCTKTQLPSLADDSGLCVDALDGAPGIHSARFAGKHRDFTLAAQKIEKALEDIKKAHPPVSYRAHFVCALALAYPHEEAVCVQGKVYGSLVFPARGSYGFGYDPIFMPDGETQTFGEMLPAKKHALSHRMKAYKQLYATIF